MATRSVARKSASVGAAGTGASPAAAAFWIAVRRSANSASVVAPITNAPRKGALRAYVPEILGEIVLACIVRSFATVGGIAGTAIERLPFPLRLPGMCSSITTWKFVPPKPKALTPARRMPPSGTVHGFNTVLT